MDTMNAKVVAGWKFHYGDQLLDNYLKYHKEKLRRQAYEIGVQQPIVEVRGVQTDDVLGSKA